ncbi:sulfatase-like hydrolase/transferase (plasmid) [Haloarcula sp. NS06]|uniref:sulfatase-like hydrolase/transferase n=1 Tax=Haloarcula sp. NS06 TaxID=3409688 RepID=UPI003DA6CEED
MASTSLLKRFEDLVKTLEIRNELEKTLVVFTSDHGELLGDYGGLYDHGAPIVPELINVPLVFAGAGLPHGEQFDGLLSTADIAPTALSAIGSDVSGADGHDLWTSSLPRSRVARTEVWKETS